MTTSLYLSFHSLEYFHLQIMARSPSIISTFTPHQQTNHQLRPSIPGPVPPLSRGGLKRFLISLRFFFFTWLNKDYYQIKNIICTLSFELALSMMYLMEPWMFSVQLTSHVTVLSCRTSFQRWPAGGTGIQDSLSIREVNNEQKLVSVDSGRLCMLPSAKLLKLFHC